MSAEMIIILGLALVNIPLYIGIGWVFFDDWRGFWEAIRYWLTPDIVSMFRGEWGEDTWQEMKLFVFILVCVLCVVGEYQLISRFFLK